MFQFRIWHKLFIATAATVVVALIVMLVLIQQNFSRGFSDYLSRWEAKQIEDLTARLIDAYAQYGDWGFLNLKRQDQQELLGVRLGPAPSDGPRQRGKGKREDGRQRPPPRAGGRQPPPPRGGGHKSRTPRDGHAPPPGGYLVTGTQLAIVDVQGRQLAGPFEVTERGERHDIVVQNELVGYLYAVRAENLDDDPGAEFSRRYSRNLMVIGGIIFVLSAPVLLLLSRRLLTPLSAVTAATQKIAGGNYGHRVKIASGDELEQLGDDFNEMADALESHRDLQRRWLAEISHELRTPLAVLKGEIEALRDGIRQPDESALDSLEQETHRLTRLVDDLYFLSVSEAGGTRYERSRLDLCELLRTTISRVELEELDLTVDLPAAAWIEGDADRLCQVFDNLLSNSQRYTDKPGSIRLALEERGRSWILRWEDSGPGLNKDELDHVFDPLFRAERSRARRYGGAGLGLAIVRAIIDKHQGTISATHSPLGGLRIEITLAKADEP